MYDALPASIIISDAGFGIHQPLAGAIGGSRKNRLAFGPLNKLNREMIARHAEYWRSAFHRVNQFKELSDEVRLLARAFFFSAGRTYVGEAAHKGQVYPGEHQGIVPRELWDRAHAVLHISPRVRANQNRAQTPALLKGLIFGVDGRALSPTHARKNGRLYRYYVAQRVLKGDAAGDDTIVRRVSAAEIEAAVVDQVRALLRQPEIVVGTWRAARKDAPDLTEAETHDALHRLDPLWEHLFPAEQARIVRSLVERVVVSPTGADIRLRLDGLGGLVRDLNDISPGALMAAA